MECIYANFNELLPQIKQQLSDKCPSDDVLREIVVKTLQWNTEKINKAMWARAIDSARQYNKDLPTGQEFLNTVNKEE